MRITILVIVAAAIAVFFLRKPRHYTTRTVDVVMPAKVHTFTPDYSPESLASQRGWVAGNPNRAQSCEGVACYYDVRVHVPGSRHSRQF